MNQILIEITDGRIVCTGMNNFDRKATANNARLLGRQLKAAGHDQLMYSSSVDFPDEHKAPCLDYRAIIKMGQIPADRR